MQAPNFLLFFIVVVLFMTYQKKRQIDEIYDSQNGIIKTYRADGSLYTEANYVDGRMNGICKTYHPDGKVFREENYVDNVLQGRALQYYQSGILYSETNYDSGKIDGIVKRFHKDGKLKAEAPYRKGCECLGLKEYILNGDPRPHYPEIVITPKDNIYETGSYTLQLSLSERVKKAEFFYGNLKDGCLHNGLVPIVQIGKDAGEIGYKLNPGAVLTEHINVVAKIETIAGNILVKQISYNVSISYRLF